jgi:hypothetical protein
MANPKEKRQASWPIPADIAAEMKRIKDDSGRTICWLLTQALRFALRPEYRRLWLDQGM